jgi:ATP-dependent Clp protease adaptor protein ClpS
MNKEKVKPVNENEAQSDMISDLILFNDDVNSFEFVIETLVEVCDHDPCQAEQCALIAHCNGKCLVRSGSFNLLKPKYDEMTRRGLIVSIE